MSNKIELKYMVTPSDLARVAYVVDPVRVLIVDRHHYLLEGYLGDSGLKLAEVGAEFFFTKSIAEKLIANKVVKLVVRGE